MHERGLVYCLFYVFGWIAINKTTSMLCEQRWDELIEALLLRHYDRSYTRAITRHYPALDHAPVVTATDTQSSTYQRLAETVLKTCN